tara:strand:- start:4278 stop:4667 length:390 start_codon:yes stop_codon:yes gene_type:complete
VIYFPFLESWIISADLQLKHVQWTQNRQGRHLSMLIDEIRQNRTSIIALTELFGAKHIRVFGSVARGEENIDSDVDFLVDFPRGYDLFAQRLPLTERLSNLLQRQVEVIPEHELNQHIRDSVLKEAIEL